ncbi:hypothetical protein SRRS_51930 [Sporomusa rhizae]|uniref:LamG-like jellyroll fold domain-containing protein n=1 Tax=Sporomusa rhizae TaxID=357999 RepID=UPI00352B44F5
MAYQVDEHTVSLLHFDDGIKDETGKVWTANGGATTSASQNKFGAGSLYLNGSGQYLRTHSSLNDFSFGAGDWTIEFWDYSLSSTEVGGLLSSDQMSFGSWAIMNNHAYGANAVVLYLSSSNSNFDLVCKIGTQQANKWVHRAIARSGSYVYSFENGVLTSTNNVGTLSLINSTSPLIGYYYNSSSNIDFFHKGYMDEIRISKGIARWNPDSPPPYDGGTPTPSVPAPTNLTATAGDAKVTLNWNAVTGATGYNVKRSTTAGGPYTTIASNVSGTSYVDSPLTNGTTYYYVVTAITANGESGPSNEAPATPQAVVTPPIGDRLLRVTVIDSSERDFQMPIADIDAFVNWFMKHTSADTAGYMLTKKVGTQSSKEYLAFDKIISFEVLELK